MKNTLWLYLPRVVTIIYIIYFSLFSLDIFGSNLTVWEQLIGFSIHSLPAIIIFLIIAVTWKKPLITGIGLIITGILMTLHYKHITNLYSFLIIELPVFLIGFSFIIFELMVKESDESDNKNTTGRIS